MNMHPSSPSSVPTNIDPDTALAIVNTLLCSTRSRLATAEELLAVQAKQIEYLAAGQKELRNLMYRRSQELRSFDFALLAGSVILILAYVFIAVKVSL